MSAPIVIEAKQSTSRTSIPRKLPRHCPPRSARRPHDVIAFAVGATHQNARITEVANLQNWMGPGPVPVKDCEYVFELDYTFVPVPCFQIRPNLQYIYSPGGSVINKDVWVLGLRTVISF